MAKIKKTRKELLKEPDEFISTTGKLIQWAVNHQRQLTYALMAVVVIALGISTYRYFSARSEKQAAYLLQQAVAKYNELKQDRSAAEAYTAVAPDFATILDDYGNKANGEIAALVFANICYEAGEFKKSLAFFEKALSHFEAYPLIRNQILSSLAMAHLNLGDDSAAIGYFEQIVDGTLDANKQEALFHLGDLYARTGQQDKSRAAYERLLNDYAESTYSDLVPKPANG